MDWREIASFAALPLLASCCKEDSNPPGFTAVQTHVEEHRVGHSADQWIEMKNAFGEWERTGLIFGYVDDYEECLKAADGLRAVNTAREYRCIPAN